MSVTLVATPGLSTSNSYATVDEANAYFDTRLSAMAWITAPEQDKALMMATTILDAMLQPLVTFNGERYVTRRTWTGAPATTVQVLAWPRTWMYDKNGNLIASNVIPQGLKNATAELAMQLITADRTLDNTVSAQGITSMRVGPVAFTFKDLVESKVLPDAVWNLLVPSWYTQEVVDYPSELLFEVM